MRKEDLVIFFCSYSDVYIQNKRERNKVKNPNNKIENLDDTLDANCIYTNDIGY